MLVIFLTFIMALYTIRTNRAYFSYHREWVKVETLLELLKQTPELRSHTTFLFDDHALNYNVNGRVLRYYEWPAYSR